MAKKVLILGISFSLFLLAVFYTFDVSFSGNLVASLGGFPFGGKVISVRNCNEGVLQTLKPAGGSPTQVMWLYSTKGYLYNLSAPPHVGQWELGMLGPTIQCTVGKVVVGEGQVISFYGSSR